jgi:hypothetical protein
MTSLAATLGALFLAFLAASAVIGLWVARVFRRNRVDVGERQKLMTLAARAAGDESGRALLELLRALDDATEGQPITVGWLARRTAKDEAVTFLVKIAWDGNEWRRAQPVAPLLASVEARLAEAPALAGPRAERLLAELREAAATA